jgi:hypothetical protein
MTKEEKSLYIFVALEGVVIGLLIGFLITDCVFKKVGIAQTNYCKEIQIDTIQYNYQQDMYKFEIKIIK